MPPYNIVKPVADLILDWAEKKGCKAIVSIEGTHAVGKKKEKMNVYGIGSNKKMVDFLKKHKLKDTKEGMITGVNGVLLYQGVLKNKDVMCLLSEAYSKFPDSRAAGNLLSKIDIMLPEIKIDPKPLFKEADIIEKKLHKFLKQSKPTAPQLPPDTHQMYG